MRAWTGPEERKLINILKKFSIKACAEILNRSGPSISRKANRLGWKGKPKGPSKAFYAEDIADMLELAEIGFSHSLLSLIHISEPARPY